MTVIDILEQAGWPTGTYGRTKCPLHGGRNRQAFSYKGELWRCYGCDEKGNAYQLGVELKIITPKTIDRTQFHGDFAAFGRIPTPTPRPVVIFPGQRLQAVALGAKQALLEGITDDLYAAGQGIELGHRLWGLDEELGAELVFNGMTAWEHSEQEYDWHQTRLEGMGT